MEQFFSNNIEKVEHVKGRIEQPISSEWNFCALAETKDNGIATVQPLPHRR